MKLIPVPGQILILPSQVSGLMTGERNIQFAIILKKARENGILPAFWTLENRVKCPTFAS